MPGLGQSIFKGSIILHWWSSAMLRQDGGFQWHKHNLSNPCPNIMGIITVNRESPWGGISLSMNYIPDTLLHFPFWFCCCFFQCWDRTDRSSYYYGDSDVSHWVQSACLSIRYCKNHERSKSHDDPNTREYYTCCSMLQKNDFLLSSHITRQIFNILADDGISKRSPLPSMAVALAPGRNKLLRLLERSNFLPFCKWKKQQLFQGYVKNDEFPVV